MGDIAALGRRPCAQPASSDYGSVARSPKDSRKSGDSTANDRGGNTRIVFIRSVLAGRGNPRNPPDVGFRNRSVAADLSTRAYQPLHTSQRTDPYGNARGAPNHH